MSRPRRVSGPGLRSIRRSDADRSNLICFPHAGGGVSFFHSWAPFLPANVGLSAVQYPGHEDRLTEALVPDMTELVRRVADEVLPICDADTILFGHSMGAVVAYEVALKALQIGAPLKRLVVSAHRPPHRSPARRAPPDAEEIYQEVRMSSRETSASIDPVTFREIFLPVLIHDYTLAHSYRRKSADPVRVPVMALAGRSDPKIAPPEMASWSSLAPIKRFCMHEFDGGHFYLKDHLMTIVSLICADPMEA